MRSASSVLTASSMRPIEADQSPSYRTNRALLPFSICFGDLAHELVVDADVVEAVVQPGQDAARGTADHRARGPQEDRAHDDADRAAAHATLHGSAVLGLVDLDPAALGAVRDRGIDDADVVVQLVDLLDGLEEPPGGLTALEHEHRQDLLSTDSTCSAITPLLGSTRVRGSLAKAAGRR